MKNYFTADWHAGEQPAPNTHSFLRVAPTDVLIKSWVEHVNKTVTVDDKLWFIGDLAITLDDLSFLKELPSCKKIIVLGDKETNNKNFTLQQFKDTVEAMNVNATIVEESHVVIQGIGFHIAHKPSDCNIGIPAICGHVHGIWRTQKKNDGQPIINVGIDAWGQLVNADLLMHQYNAVTQGYYDQNAFINL